MTMFSAEYRLAHSTPVGMEVKVTVRSPFWMTTVP